MTTTSKAVLGIALAAVILVIAFYALRMHDAGTNAQSADAATLPTPANDTSDSAMDKDAAAIDAQLKGLSDDDATVDQGIQTHATAQ
ncbi:MAG: hypothetical protein V4480_02965 [Patescibacteria group bacterium]